MPLAADPDRRARQLDILCDGRHRRTPRPCATCGQEFLAGDPKNVRCPDCRICANPDCDQMVKRASHRYCSRSCARISEASIAQRARIHEQTRQSNPARRPEVRAKISEGVTRNHPSRIYPERWEAHARYMRGVKPIPSRLEDRFAMIHPDLPRQYLLNDYRFDFADPERQIVYETHGCWWHLCEQCYPGMDPYPRQLATLRNDRLKAEAVHAAGWTLRVVWEHELTGGE